MSNLNIAIIGASGGIGSAFVKLFAKDLSNSLYVFSRSTTVPESENVHSGYLDFGDETSIEVAAKKASQNEPLDMVIVATGILHENDMMPEKSLKSLSVKNLERNFLVNTIGPALLAKHFLPKLYHDKRTVFAVLSARVGSISDNHLGGWYSYRASKAALNMLIRTTSIEVSRRYKQMIVVGLHPGTVKTSLSKPFQSRVPKGKLFSADYSASQLVSVIDKLIPEDSGKIFAWDGSQIAY